MCNIEKVLEYYRFQSEKVKEYVNHNSNLTEDEIIQKGKKLEELEYKITALEIVKSEGPNT